MGSRRSSRPDCGTDNDAHVAQRVGVVTNPDWTVLPREERTSHTVVAARDCGVGGDDDAARQQRPGGGVGGGACLSGEEPRDPGEPQPARNANPVDGPNEAGRHQDAGAARKLGTAPSLCTVTPTDSEAA